MIFITCYYTIVQAWSPPCVQLPGIEISHGKTIERTLKMLFHSPRVYIEGCGEGGAALSEPAHFIFLRCSLHILRGLLRGFILLVSIAKARAVTEGDQALPDNG